MMKENIITGIWVGVGIAIAGVALGAVAHLLGKL